VVLIRKLISLGCVLIFGSLSLPHGAHAKGPQGLDTLVSQALSAIQSIDPNAYAKLIFDDPTLSRACPKKTPTKPITQAKQIQKLQSRLAACATLVPDWKKAKLRWTSGGHSEYPVYGCKGKQLFRRNAINVYYALPNKVVRVRLEDPLRLRGTYGFRSPPSCWEVPAVAVQRKSEFALGTPCTPGTPLKAGFTSAPAERNRLNKRIKRCDRRGVTIAVYDRLNAGPQPSYADVVLANRTVGK